jgi:hypothetical protein
MKSPHGKIAMMLLGKTPPAGPELHEEPDGDEPMVKPAGLDATMEKLAQLSPEALVDLIATIANENPEVLKAIQTELGEGEPGMAGEAPAQERAY